MYVKTNQIYDTKALQIPQVYTKDLNVTEIWTLDGFNLNMLGDPFMAINCNYPP